ncbi:transcription factor GTE8 isoform X2 [Neltuma alba]|uniref:transcription factor GTE8 isoform X2 n=1 Tax=Neltuma alba TaxID=207710 RepID=UPI0010A50F6C|nr:transcription factor GTE8-like isoform X2 [Prosopis alba]
MQISKLDSSLENFPFCAKFVRSLNMMMAKSNRFSGGYYGNAVEIADESEGSGSSGPIDTEITVSENSSVPARRCVSLNSSHCDNFGVPMQVLRLSDITPLERKDLVLRLRSELEQIQRLQKKVELQRTNAVALSSTSDILSCSNGHNRPQLEKSRKSLAPSSVSGKKLNPTGQKPRGWNRGSSGKFEPAPQTQTTCSPTAANTLLMKQCEALLKRLMNHQYAWVFNTPVDVVKLNLPDYFTVIKHPMDLGTIKSKIASGAYSGPLEFCEDVKLTFSNAMTYNPPGNDVHVMAATLSKYFEVRWKAIEKKIPKTNAHPMPVKSCLHEDVEAARPMPPSKKRKITTIPHYPEVVPPVKRVMTDEEKHNLGIELESLLGELPAHIVDFLKEHSSSGKECGEDEIEIDIDDLSDDTLSTLRKLLDEYLQEKQKCNEKAELCEIELLNDSGPSNLSLQAFKGDDLGDEDVDIGGNEPPVTSYPPVEIEKDATYRINRRSSPGSSSDSSGSSDSESKDAKTGLVRASKVADSLGHGAQLDEKTQVNDTLEKNQPVVGLDPVDDSSEQKPNSFDSDQCRDGDSAPRQVSPDKLYRAALLKNRFADTILKAREKTLIQGQKGDSEKLHREREKLEMERRKEKARLQAEAKAAEDARKRAEAEAAAEARRKRELEREAARQALIEVEKSVDVVESSRVLKDLELLRAAPAEQQPSSVDETSPDHSQDGLGSFKFGSNNPLEQLGLYMKVDDEEEFGEPPSTPHPVNDVEEGEID